MEAKRPIQTLSGLIEQLEAKAGAGESISIRSIEQVAGTRIAGPLLLFPALVVVSPLSLVPTLPTIIAMTIIVIASQLVAGRKTIWLPKFLATRSLSASQALKVAGFLKRPAAWLSSVSKPRLQFMVGGLSMRIAASICVLVALTMPPLELIPGASTIAGIVISVFGLSLTTQDGVLLIISLALAIGSGLVIFGLLF